MISAVKKDRELMADKVQCEELTREDKALCPHNTSSNCLTCRLGSICLPLALETDEVVKLDAIVRRGRPLQKSSLVYREGEAFTSVYAVRSGTIKTYCATNDGQEQITGFYFPGEVFGMDGISKDTYACSAQALDVATVCEIPFHRLEELSVQVPSMQRHFFQLMSREIITDQQLITLLSKNSADERIATLFLSISSRYARRKLSKTKFRLPMSRGEIGNYLGLTIETVSRVISRFNKRGLIKVENKEICLLDIASLQEIAGITAD